MEQIFDLSGLPVLPIWLLMIALPHWRVTRRIVESPLIALIPALIYAALALPRFAEIFPAVSSPRLPAIMALLGSESGATIAWVHFLAFDLLVGRWIYLDSRERAISQALIAPVLFFTLMLGPVGFVAYLALRAAWAAFGRRTTLHRVTEVSQ